MLFMPIWIHIENNVVITKKEKVNYLYAGAALVISGIAVLLYLVETRGASGDFITVFGKLGSLVAIIYGVVYLVRYDRFSQDKDVKFDIEDGNLTFEDKSYPLEESFLTLQFTTTPKKDMYRVTLFLEKEAKAQKIFEHVVFDIDEMAKFLKLIKPYRKTQVCLVSETPRTIQLFKGGFAYEGREILYDEVEKFDAILVNINATIYLDVKIALKNGDTIEKRLTNGMEEYARAKYASLVFKNGG